MARPAGRSLLKIEEGEIWIFLAKTARFSISFLKRSRRDLFRNGIFANFTYYSREDLDFCVFFPSSEIRLVPCFGNLSITFWRRKSVITQATRVLIRQIWCILWKISFDISTESPDFWCFCYRFCRFPFIFLTLWAIRLRKIHTIDSNRIRFTILHDSLLTSNIADFWCIIIIFCRFLFIFLTVRTIRYRISTHFVRLRSFGNLCGCHHMLPFLPHIVDLSSFSSRFDELGHEFRSICSRRWFVHWRQGLAYFRIEMHVV